MMHWLAVLWKSTRLCPSQKSRALRATIPLLLWCEKLLVHSCRGWWGGRAWVEEEGLWHLVFLCSQPSLWMLLSKPASHLSPCHCTHTSPSRVGGCRLKAILEKICLHASFFLLQQTSGMQRSGKISQHFHPDSARLFLSCFCLLKQQCMLAKADMFHSYPPCHCRQLACFSGR